jgi:hypothetical protein
MQIIREHDLEKKDSIMMIKMDNAEFVNPIEKYMNDTIDWYKQFTLNHYRFCFEHNKPSPIGKISLDKIWNHLEREGLKVWAEQYQKIMKEDLPENIFQLLTCNNKTTQIKLLKHPLFFTTKSLSKFIFQAWQKYGFKYSVYHFEHHQKGLNPKELPNAFLKEDNSFRIYGKTNMKDGQLKNALDGRKNTMVKFLDNGETWHCFYYNYKSINGQENHDIPHIHYISNNWTIPREAVLKELGERHHKFSSSVHVNYTR